MMCKNKQTDIFEIYGQKYLHLFINNWNIIVYYVCFMHVLLFADKIFK